MILGEHVRKALQRKEALIRVWRPSWPKEAYLEIEIISGVLSPVGRAVLTDASGQVVGEQMVMMLFAPIANDYEEWKGS